MSSSADGAPTSGRREHRRRAAGTVGRGRATGPGAARNRFPPRVAQLGRAEIGEGRLLSPDKRAGLFEVELPRELPVEQLERFLGRELRRPQLVIGRHRERGVVAVEHAVAVIDGVEERNRFPAVRRGVAFAADLQAEHEIEIRQPVLAATFAGQRRTRRATSQRRRMSAAARGSRPSSMSRRRPDGRAWRRSRPGWCRPGPCRCRPRPARRSALGGQAGVFVPPELRAHAHRGARATS